MFPMTLTIHNPAQLHAVLAAIGATTVTATAVAAPATQDAALTADKKDAAAQVEKSAKVAPARSKPTAEVAAADAPAQSTGKPEPQSSTEPGADASSAADPVTYDQVAKAITDTAKVDRALVVSALAKFGAKKGPELKAENYADFLAALQ